MNGWKTDAGTAGISGSVFATIHASAPTQNNAGAGGTNTQNPIFFSFNIANGNAASFSSSFSDFWLRRVFDPEKRRQHQDAHHKLCYEVVGLHRAYARVHWQPVPVGAGFKPLQPVCSGSTLTLRYAAWHLP